MKLLRRLRADPQSRHRALTEQESRAVWQSASLILDYPDSDWSDRIALARGAAQCVPDVVAKPLLQCCDQLSELDLGQAQEEYVETFDNRRRHNLFLTYFAHGDTRKRGLALLRFKQTYQKSGLVLDDTGVAGAELPDHLCVVLEFAATVDHDAGRQLMLDHRAGLELLRLSLVEAGSPWAGAVQAVTSTLPTMQDSDMEAVRRLAAQGPPEEEVGLSPYGESMFDPGPAVPDSAGPISLPMPSFPGGR